MLFRELKIKAFLTPEAAFSLHDGASHQVSIVS